MMTAGQSDLSSLERYFSQHDANFNITSITDANGQVAERYLYTPYGEVLPDWYLGGSWETLQGGTTQLGWTYLFQDRPLDSASGKYDFRNRPYDAPTGRFTSADPLGYPDGANRYLAFGGNPVRFVDPMGLCKAGLVGPPRHPDPTDYKYNPGMSDGMTVLKEKLADIYLGADRWVRHPIDSFNDFRDGAIEGTAQFLAGRYGDGVSESRAVTEGIAYILGSAIGLTDLLEASTGTSMVDGRDLSNKDRQQRAAVGVAKAAFTAAGVEKAFGSSPKTGPVAMRSAAAGEVDLATGRSLGQLYDTRNFGRLRTSLRRSGVELRTNADTFIRAQGGKDAGALFMRYRSWWDRFLGGQGRTVLALRKSATIADVAHELRHFNLWRQMGKDAYWRLSRAFREQYVFDWFRKGPLWMRMTPAQQMGVYDGLLRVGGNPLK